MNVQKVVLIEDDPFKEYDVTKVLKACNVKEILKANNLKEGIELIENNIDSIDLVVTDMYYPTERGGQEVKSGEVLIERVKQIKEDMPIIVCSSVALRLPNVLGTVHYSPKEDWELDLSKLIR